MGKGRPKGARNKQKQVATAIKKTFWDLGGEAYLRQLAEQDPRMFNQILARVIEKNLDEESRVTAHEEWLRILDERS